MIELEGAEAMHPSELEAQRRYMAKLKADDPNAYAKRVEGMVNNHANQRPVAKALAETGAGFVPIVGQIIDGKDIYQAFTKGTKTDKAISLLAIIPGFDILKSGRKVFKYVAKNADEAKAITNKVDDISGGADFVVTPNGTAVSTDLNKVQEGFDNAGFNKVQDTELNSIYEVPKSEGSGTFNSRLQKGKAERTTDYDGDRVINTQNDGNLNSKQYVNPDGRGITGSKTKSERKAIGHVHLKE